MVRIHPDEPRGNVFCGRRWCRGEGGGRPRGFRSIVPIVVCLAFSLCIVALPAARGGETAAQTAQEPKAAGVESAVADPKTDGLIRYPVSKFILSYGREHPAHPPLEPLTWYSVALGEVKDGLVAPREGIPNTTIQLGNFTGESARYFYGSAIRRIVEQYVEYLNDQGLAGVFIAPDAKEIDARDSKDLREATKTELHLVVWTTVVKEARTIASGERIPPEERINNPAHARILKRSPVKPFEPGAPGVRGDLLRKDVLDAYLFRLNRDPGRRVDVAISSAGNPGEGTLDFLVSENKQWLLFSQVSNTGTKETSHWRERFGFVHYQLTDRDDILSLDYVTGNFDTVNAVVGSYESPFSYHDRLRWRVFGIYSQFDASEVGISKVDFTGEERSGGAEIIGNILQQRESFLDLVGGFQWRDIMVNNKTLAVKGESDFALPYVNLELERRTATAATSGALGLEHNLKGLANTHRKDAEELGRMNVDPAWWLLKLDFSHSFFVEPLLRAREWERKDLEGATMAHEVLFSLKGQYAGGYRLIPQEEEVIGGRYTVRGYPESVTAGDSVVVGSLEYRYHIPMGLKPEPVPKSRLFGRTFRWRPQQPLSRPDWDLALAGFVDAGRTWLSAPLSTEHDESLVSTGVGLGLQVARNLNVRVDWGVALKGTQDDSVDAGDSRIHIVATLVW